MKRKAKPEAPITECYTRFFWKDCCACKCQFRRERGWKKEAMEIAFMPFRYLCATCAPDETTAEEIFESRPWRIQLPSTPPKAPPRGR